ncbi:cyclic peptide transporter [Paenibacillus dendritiformis C454]|uniref:Cyclic peptide transporter n=1 Tax=Paenibacillus dendritiformis C454 TaxID=1131935 RepID=H3SBA8_9BACL|nr:serine hydrolase domain-containing protein [Paenibacillus dendritiformis]EHQ63591.1 cyclic peptide transporter [Paenibacillus dendritiformis C454]
MKRLAVYLFIAALLVRPAALAAEEGAPARQGQPDIDEAAVERFVQAELEKAQSPGAAVVVVSGDQVVYANGFGLADREAGIPATSSTLFQLGSTSKAFTGLALLELEQQGALRLDDPVARYLPWLQLNYEGQAVKVTLGQLLHHTSGVPFASIASIPEDSGEQALERTVRALSGSELDTVPGSKYQYATINYDVLGLVIQEVSGMSYEAYMSGMLQRLGLHDTMPMAQLNDRQRLAAGYKIGFGSPRLYQAPDYRGNTPAGYLVANADDIGRWLLLQLGAAGISPSDRAIIERSHRPDTNAGPDENGASYAAGWFVSADGKEISHQGSNPNFSSFIIFRPQERLGVGVLANINSAYTFHIGSGLMSLLREREPPPAQADFYPQLDRIAMAGLAIIAVSLIVPAAAAIRIPLQLRRKRRAFVPPRGRRLFVLGAAILTAGACFWGLGKLLDKIFAGLPLDVAAVWCPVSVIWFIYAFCFAAGIAFLFFVAVWLLPKVRRPPLPIPAEEVK